MKLTAKELSKAIKSYVAINGNNLKDLNKELSSANVSITYKSARYDYDNPLNSNDSRNEGVYSNDK